MPDYPSILALAVQYAPGVIDPAAVVAAIAAAPPSPRPSSDATYVTYALLGDMPAPFGLNATGKLHDGLAAWAAAPDLSAAIPAAPNPGALTVLQTRLSGSKGLDFSSDSAPALLSLLTSGVDAQHPPLLTAQQAAVLLGIGYVVPVVPAAADVAAAFAWQADQSARGKATAALASVLNDQLATASTTPAAATVVSWVQAALAAAGVA